MIRESGLLLEKKRYEGIPLILYRSWPEYVPEG